ncbi:unnamed protein product [Pedinophyceae sp. YPF-701]|nr:unnamed protein product [Pedinophyceae sp. YPF-701]
MTDIADMVDSAVMDDLEDRFQLAADYLPSIVERVPDAQKLEMYGFYKQAMEGQCGAPKPGMFDFKGKAKWEAWSKLGDMGKYEAMLGYVETLTSIEPHWEANIEEAQGKPKKAYGPVFSSLIAHDDDDDDEPPEGSTPLHNAVRTGDLAAVQRELQRDPQQASAADVEGYTPLHLAADSGAEDVVRALLASGADANARDAEGQTPLHCAVLGEHEGVTRALLDCGGDAGAPDNAGETPAAGAPAAWASWLASGA